MGRPILPPPPSPHIQVLMNLKIWGEKTDRVGKELTSQFFPPGKELTSQFFPRGKNGPAHSFPGEKLTGEKTDRHTGSNCALTRYLAVKIDWLKFLADQSNL